jgi:nicotinate-nucleotide adenylyltransferase
MKTLCLGGSFNPIHHGHLICARAAAETGGFDRILLIPSRLPPHKQEHRDIAAPEHRLRMCQLAVAGSAMFDVDDLELFRSGPSFTIETAQQLLQRPGFGAVNWLIGADTVSQLPSWHRPLELIKLVNFIIMARPGYSIDWTSLPNEYRPLERNVLTVPLIQISACEIRQRVRGGLSIDYLTPRTVIEYIVEHQLY